MKRFAPLGVAVIAALIAQCALADKSGELIDATNPKKIASVIQDLGYQALVGRAYLDEDGDPWFDWAVNIRDGVSRENFEDSKRRWGESLGDFEDHIDY